MRNSIAPRSRRPLNVSLARLTSRAALFATMALAGSSSAATIQWDGEGADLLWGTAANWFDLTNTVNNVAPLATDDLQFGTAGAGIINLGGNQAANSLQFTLNGFSLGTAATTDTLTISSGLVTVNPTVTSTLNAVVTANNLTLSGGGILVLNNAANALTGTTTVNGGTLRVTAPTALGTANTINSGTLEVAGITLDRAMTLNTGATLLGTGATSSSTGTMTVASGASVSLNSGAVGEVFTLGNAANDITGGGSGAAINVGGSGTVVLAQANNVTADWRVTSGTLQINNIGTGGLGVAASTIRVDNGGTFAVNPGSNATINNAITLNGGTLSNISTAGQLTVGTAGMAVNANSTIRNLGPGTQGKITIGANLLTGTGNITKVGGGVLTFSGVNSGYTGSFFVNEGVLEGGTGMLGSNTITIDGGEVAASNGTLANPILITPVGGALSAVSGTGTFSGPITANGAFNVNLKDFHQATARNTNISGAITGAGNMTVLATAGAATLTLSGNNTGYTGGVTIGNGTGTNPTVIVRGTNALNGNTVTLNGGTLALQSDGNGTNSPQAVAFNDNIIMAVSSNITVNRAATEFAPLFTTAQNKTLQLGNLDIGAQTLTVTGTNGYGLDFTGQTTLSATPTFSVTPATGSTVVQALTFSGKVTGGFGFTKSGVGTLALGNTGNDFIGNITVGQGVLSFSDPLQFGNAANVIVLAPTTGTSTLRATETLTTSRTISLANAVANTRAIEVATGKTLTLTSPFDIAVGSEGATLVKNDSGTLALSAANPVGWTGGMTINGGAVLVTNAGAFGAPTSVVTISPSVAATGAALQLAGNIALPNNVSLQGTGNVLLGGINAGGQIQSVSGTNTTIGSIIIAFDALIGADAGSTLNIAGGIHNNTTSARSFAFMANGTINVNSSITSATSTANQYFAIQKYGTGTLNFSTAQPVLFTTASTQNITFSDGTTNFIDAGSLTGTNSIAATVNPGARLVLDNTVQVIGNRLGSRGLILTGGKFDVIGGATATNEAMGALTLNRGHSEITVTAGIGEANLTFGAPTRAGGATALFRGTSLGNGAGAGVATIASTTTGFTFSGPGTAGSTNKGILPWALVDNMANGTGFSFATADTATSILRPLSGSEVSTTLSTGNNVILNTSESPGSSLSINSLMLDPGANITNAANSTLTVTSGGILARSGNTLIQGGFLTQGTGEMIIHTVGDLEIGSTIVGGAGGANFALTKSGAGTLSLNLPSRHTGQTVVNQGTLLLNAGNNTIAAQNYLAVGKGGSVNLLGNAQLVTDLFADATVANNGGTVTGAAGSLIVLNRDNSPRNWAGRMTGAMGFVRGGTNTLTLFSDNNYTGPTILTGGTTTLRDVGALSATSRIDIKYATLRLDNAVGMQIDLNNRINDAAPINLYGGNIFLAGHVQAASRESFGALTLTRGVSEINMLVGTTGTSSAELTFASLNQANNATTNFQTAAGAIGNSARIFFGNGMALLNNNILPVWIEKGGNDWASYNPTQGLGAINDAGYAGYNGTTFPAAAAGTTHNIALGATGAVATGGQTLNTLNIRAGAFNVNFADPADVLNLAAGGLIKTGAAATFGATADSGRLTAGGTASTGTVPLYIHTQTNGWTMNSRIVDNPNGAAVRMVYTTYNGGNMTLAAPNTYTGGTVIQGWAGGTAGTLTLGATGTIPAGGISIYNANFTQVAGGTIDPSNVITVGGANSTTSGVITLTGNNTLAGLVFDNDGGLVSPAVNTGGVLTLTGGITATSTNVSSLPVLNGTVDLGGNNAAFNVSPITIEGQNVASFLPTVNVAAVIQNGGIVKSGAGILGIAGANTISGPTSINAGTIQFTANGAGLGASTVTANASGTLNLGGFSGSVGGLTGTGTIINSAGGLPLTATSTLTLGGNGASTTFAGLISGSIALSKIGGGTFALSNPGNTFTGGIVVSGGSLALAGAGIAATGTGLVTVNNTGSLINAGLIPGGIAFNPGSSASIALSATAPLNTGTSALSATGPVTLNLTGSPAIGTFPLIDYDGTALTSAQFAGFRLGTTPGGGFLYGLFNNTATSSVEVSVEAVGASNTWTGSADGSWNPGDVLNWTTPYQDGQQVTFNDSGSNKTLFGAAVAPQAITVTNTVGNDYTIGNTITGTLAGGISKNGTGTLQLTGGNLFSGPIMVNGGTLRASAATGASGLGSGNITLNNSTLQLDPASTALAGLTGRTISGAVTSNVVTQRDFNQIALDTRTFFATGNADIAIGTNPFYTGGPIDNFSIQFTGKLRVTLPGNYSFFTQSDDGSRVFIDGQLVGENDGSHGNTGGDVGGVPIFLSAGYHDVRLEATEGTGNGGVQFRWQGPGFAKTFVTSANLLTAETSSSAGASSNIAIGNNVTINGTSTINLNGTDFVGVELGGLSHTAGSTLNVTGLRGKLLRAASASFNGGSVTINTTPDVALGQLLDNGSAVNLLKLGAGRLILDNTGAGGRASSMLSTSTIDVQAGKLVLVGAFSNSANGATNPAGSARVRLSGGSLLLDTKGSTVVGSGTTSFDNAITTVQNALIEALPVGSGVATATSFPIVLGSATNGITLATASTLTLDVYGGSRNATTLSNGFIGNQVAANGALLVLNGPVTGDAGIVVQSSQFNGANIPVVGNVAMTAANTYTGATNLRGMIYNAPNVFGGGLVSAATTSGAPLTLALSGNGTLLNTSEIVFNTARLTIDNGGTNLSAGAGRIADSLPISLNNSVLHYLGNTTAASGETVGTLTINGGLNAVSMTGTATGFATTVTASSLGRANNAQVIFQGNAIGSAATASNLLKFTTAPTSTLVNGVQLVGGGGVIGGSAKNVSILPFAVGTATTTGTLTWRFMGYDATNGVRPLDITNEVEAMSATTALANVRDTAAVAATIIGRGTPINSWIIDDTSTSGGPHLQTLSGTATLNSGALLLTSSSATQQALSLTGGTVDFGAVEGIITTMSVVGSTIASTLSGTMGLTVGGIGQTAITADNSATLTGPITVNGLLSIPADNALGAPTNAVNLNGGILKFTAATTVASTRPVSLLANTTSTVDTTTGNSVIAGPITGSGGLAKISGNTLTLSNTGNTYTGRTEVYTGTLVTTTGPTGDIINNGAVTFDQAFDGTYPGIITGFGSFSKAGTGQATLSAQQNYTGATTLTGGTLVLGVDQTLPIGTGFTMGSAANVTSLVANGHQTFNTVAITGTATTHTMTIAPGKTVNTYGATTVSGGAGITVSGGGEYSIGGDFNVGVNNNTGSFKMTAGTLTMNGGPGTNLNLGTKTATTAGNVAGTIDLTGVSNFTANVGNIRVGVDVLSAGGTMAGTTFKLATNNTITASTSFVVGDSPNDGSSSGNSVVLGSGTNIITTPLMTVGGRKIGASMTINAGGVLLLTNGASPTDLNVGINSAGSASNPTSTFNMTGGTLVANLNNLVIGGRTGAPSGAAGGGSTGTFILGTSGSNSVTANSIIIGQTSASTGGTAPVGTATGTLTINGGNLTAGSIILAQRVNGNANGTLNLVGGTTTLTGDLSDGGGTSTLILNNGTLDMTGKNIGAGGATIDTLTLAAGTLKNVAEINGGAPVTKSTSGVLIMDGTLAYTGATTVAAGTLQVRGTLSGTPSVTVAAGAILNGGGTINGSALVSGTLAPGLSPGKLTVNGVAGFDVGSTFAIELNGITAATGYDQLVIGLAGEMQIAPGSNLSLALNYPAELGAEFTIVDNFGISGISGAFGNLLDQGNIDAVFNGGTWSFQADYTGGDGNDLTLTVVAVPEPTTALTIMGGIGMLALLRRGRRSS